VTERYDPYIILKPEMVTMADTARLDSFTKIEGGNGVTIGEYVHICSFVHINPGGGQVEIGDYAGVASGARILGGTNMPEGFSMSSSSPRHLQVVARTKTVIGVRAFIGAGAIIMPGVTVGEGAVVGAGSVVYRDVESWTMVAGNPARKIGERPHESD